MFRSPRPHGPLDASAEIEGLALEGSWPSTCAPCASSGPGGASPSFWRTHAGLEVGFVLYEPGLFRPLR